jgi:hypothetical protein
MQVPPEFTLGWMQLAALIFGPTGAAWVGVKAGLNGQRARLISVEAEHRASMKRMETSLSRIENRMSMDHDDLIKLQANHMELVRDLKYLRETGCKQLSNHLSILRQLEQED